MSEFPFHETLTPEETLVESRRLMGELTKALATNSQLLNKVGLHSLFPHSGPMTIFLNSKAMYLQLHTDMDDDEIPFLSRVEITIVDMDKPDGLQTEICLRSHFGNEDGHDSSPTMEGCSVDLDHLLQLSDQPLTDQDIIAQTSACIAQMRECYPADTPLPETYARNLL